MKANAKWNGPRSTKPAGAKAPLYGIKAKPPKTKEEKKEDQRRRIEQDVQTFLDNGGTIARYDNQSRRVE